MSKDLIYYAHIGSNIVALLMIWLCAKWAAWGRIAFAVVFIWAGQVNWRIAHSTPGDYLDYATLTSFPVYREFILGYFSRHIPEFVSIIAVGQVAAGLLILMPGKPATFALNGAMVFLILIAPLGVGSGFPTTLLMAIGIWILLRKKDHQQNLFPSARLRFDPRS